MQAPTGQVKAISSRRLFAFAGIFTCTIAGCATTNSTESQVQIPVAPLQHVVLFDLVDPSDAAALAADCASLGAGVPTVRSTFVGTHADIGRTNIARDYDLALIVGFDDIAGYRAYLDHPLHLELLNKWKPRVEKFTIYDAGDKTVVRD